MPCTTECKLCHVQEMIIRQHYYTYYCVLQAIHISVWTSINNVNFNICQVFFWTAPFPSELLHRQVSATQKTLTRTSDLKGPCTLKLLFISTCKTHVSGWTLCLVSVCFLWVLRSQMWIIPVCVSLWNSLPFELPFVLAYVLWRITFCWITA